MALKVFSLHVYPADLSALPWLLAVKADIGCRFAALMIFARHNYGLSIIQNTV
jgi:hypothetical protein